MNENVIVGIGMNKSQLTVSECLTLIADLSTIFESFSNDDLDSLYKVATGHWAYHSTRQNLIDTVKKYQFNNSVC